MEQVWNGGEKMKHRGKNKYSRRQALMQKQRVCGRDSFAYPSSSSWTFLPKWQQQLQAKEEPL